MGKLDERSVGTGKLSYRGDLWIRESCATGFITVRSSLALHCTQEICLTCVLFFSAGLPSSTHSRLKATLGDCPCNGPLLWIFNSVGDVSVANVVPFGFAGLQKIIVQSEHSC